MKWFNKKPEEVDPKEDPDKDAEKKDAGSDKSEKAVTPPLPPVSFFQLFRYSTTSEIVLDLLGVVAATGSGAAQPILGLLFGSLALNFVTFTTTLKQFQDGEVTADQFNLAADDFRKAASKNATFFVYAGIGVLVCTFFYMYIWSYTSEVNSKRIREHYLQSVLKQDVEYFDELGAGEVVTRIQGDTDLVQRGISEKVPMCIQFVGAFIAGFVLAFVKNWRLALAMSSILPCIMLTGAAMGKFMVRYTQLSSDATGSAGTISEESISTIRTAKAFNTPVHIGALYKNKVLLASQADMGLALVLGFGIAIMFFISYAAYGLAFSFGTTLINQGHADAGEIITVFMAIFIGSFSLTVMGPQAAAITTGCGAAAKLFATIDRIPTIDSSSPEGDKPATVHGSIKFDDVSFIYPSRPDVTVLSNISLTFEAGKSYALVGPSGSGKSTIVSLLERFYDPKSGSITLDGADLTTLNLRWLRRHIGLVAQEPVLFGTTVMNNVAHGLAGSKHEHATDEVKFKLIKQACIKANAHDFIMKLPKGYNTVVGERGFMLSGGQKQRVAIARAIISDPPILLLDEATSALDTQSEELVQDALSKASQGRTTITIAHRLSTIRNSDKIYVINGGKVVEEGSHDELLNLSGVYSRLVEAQGLKKQIGNTPTPDMIAAPSTTQSSLKKNKDPEKDTSSEIYFEDRQFDGGTELDGKSGKRKRRSIFYLIPRVASIVKDKWLKYVVGIVSSLVVGLVYPAFGIVYAAGINGFSDPDPHVRRFQGDRNALWFFIISIINGLAAAAQNYYLAGAAATLVMRLREMSFRAVMYQDVQFFDDEKNTSGALTERINSDPKKMSGIAGATLGTIFQSISTLLAGIILGIAIAWKIGLVGLACIPFLLSAGFTGLFVVILKDERNKKDHEQSAQVACESAGAIRTVASLTREEGCLGEYSLSLQEPLNRAISWGALSMFAYAFAQASMFFIMALVFWYGSQLVSRLEISLFQLFIGLMATTFGALQAGGMFQMTPDVSAAATAADNIISLIDSPSTIEGYPQEDLNEKNSDRRERIEGRIEAKDIHFHYPMRPDIAVLQGLTFSVEPGQYVAFVGASGSGKSTIIQLVERFYDVTSGSIYIGDHPLKDLNLSTYRKDVALVSQEPTLYSGSIKFNILLGATKPHPEVTQEEIEEACRKANILDFIQGLPDGFETTVGNKGSQLSGGQKQRVAIARALIRDPKILLLDEATSALDTASEKVVQAALDEAAKGRTTIAIAHRLSTIQDADKIFFVKNGGISESGTHDELLSLRGDYYGYVQLQMLQQES